MRSYTITKIWDIPIRINISLIVFLPILAWLIGSGQQIELYTDIINGYSRSTLRLEPLRAGVTPWIIGSAAAIGLFVSVTLHELGHSWAAMRYGLTIESITLWLLGGLANLSAIPREWKQEFTIAIAGPITSLLVALVCFIGIQIIPGSLPVLLFVVGWLAITNVVLAVFNLLPAFPMDGGRILRSLLARSQPYATATRTAARIGSMFAVLFAVVGILSFNPMLLLLALFIYGAATTESRVVALDDLLEGITVGDVMARDVPTLSVDDSLSEFVSQMLRDRRTSYPVEDESGTVVGVITLANLKQVRQAEHETTQIQEVMLRDVPRLSTTDDAFDALSLLGKERASVALVEEAGSVVGIATQEDFSETMQVQKLAEEFHGPRVAM